MKILVHCTKPMLVVHHHPHLMKVAGQEKNQHLGKPHDHYVDVTVKMECRHLERDKDLLLLHTALEETCGWPKRQDMGHASFEQMCEIIANALCRHALRLGSVDHLTIHSIKVAAVNEGAELIWENQ